MGSSPKPLCRRARSASPRPVRRRPSARLRPLRRDRRRLSGLFQEPPHGEDHPTAGGPCGTSRPASSASTPCSLAGESTLPKQRAVLHVALRAPERESILLDGTDVVQEGHRVRRQMVAFADRLWSDEWKGHTGVPIRNIVNIGIGGSDLGPRMACAALEGLQRPQPHLLLRLQRRRYPALGSASRLRAGGDVLRRLLQDIHRPWRRWPTRGQHATGSSRNSAIRLR